MSKRLTIALTSGLLVLLGACGNGPSATTANGDVDQPASTTTTVPAPPEPSWSDHSYRLNCGQGDGPRDVTLHGGKAQVASYPGDLYPGSATLDEVARIDVDDDGATDVAVSVNCGYGAHTNEDYVFIFDARDGSWQSAGPALSGTSISRDGEHFVRVEPIYSVDDAGCCPSNHVSTRYGFRNGRFRVETSWLGDGPAPASATSAPATLEPVRTWARAFPQKLSEDGQVQSLVSDLDSDFLDSIPVPVGFEALGWSSDSLCYEPEFLVLSSDDAVVDFYRRELPRAGMKFAEESPADSGGVTLRTDQDVAITVTSAAGASVVNIEMCLYEY